MAEEKTAHFNLFFDTCFSEFLVRYDICNLNNIQYSVLLTY